MCDTCDDLRQQLDNALRTDGDWLTAQAAYCWHVGECEECKAQADKAVMPEMAA